MSTVTARARVASLQLPGVRLGAQPAEPVRRLPTGIGPLDALLDGGLPHGHLSELVGGLSSGRTALLQALLASATQRGEVAAVIDLLDTLDPPSLARAGVDLDRVLWVRPPAPQSALRCAELILSAGGFGLVALDLGVERAADSGQRIDGFAATRRARSAVLPHSAWVRLAQATRRATAVVVLCVPRRVTVSGAAVVLNLARRRVYWSAHLFDGLATVAELTRSRFSPTERVVGLAFGDRRTAPDGGTIERLHAGWSGGGGVDRATRG